MGPVRWLVRWIAGLLRAAASALDGGDRLDAATAALAARFPGAPEHWLRYIAARAPQLAAAEVAETQAGPPSAGAEHPAAPRVRWWWPRTRARRASPLHLPRRELVERPRPGEQPEAPEIGKTQVADERRGRRMAPRPRLHLAGPLEPRRTPEASLKPGTALRSPPKTSLRLATEERASPRADLRAAVGPAAQRPEPPRAEAQNEQGEEARRAGHLHLAVRSGRDEVHVLTLPAPAEAPKAGTAEQPTAPLRPARGEWASWTSSGPALRSEEFASRHRDRDAPPAASFTPWRGQAPRRASIGRTWPAEAPQNNWPELPPLEPADIANAPARLPNIDRLRAEQDHGSWSG
ncbi:MAG TPA: hypothetical protein VMU08_14185 [Rhizomicrobium sp.]|nr:hypothetical protein [Rhizomicrobium sp.]